MQFVQLLGHSSSRLGAVLDTKSIRPNQKQTLSLSSWCGHSTREEEIVTKQSPTFHRSTNVISAVKNARSYEYNEVSELV